MAVWIRNLTLSVAFSLLLQCSSAHSQDKVSKLDQPERYIVTAQEPDVFQGKERTGVAIQGALLEVSHHRGPWRFSKNLDGWIHKKNLVLLKNAVKQFSSEIEKNPTPMAFHLRGIAYMAQENWGRAVNDLEESYKLGDSSVTLHINLGTSLLNLGLVDKAKSEFSIVIENFPDEAAAYQARGDLFVDLGDYDKALTDLRKAAELVPKSAETYNSIGVALRMKGEYPEAIKAYGKSIEFDPKFMSAYVNRGFAYKNLKQFPKALQDYEFALKLDPASPSVKNDLAWLLATCEDEKILDGEKAVKLSLAACSTVEYRKSEYVDTLAAAYARVGKFAKAVETAQSAIELFNDETEIASCKKRLKLYRDKKAFIDKIQTEE